MDFGSVLGALVSLGIALVGGLGWLFKLHGDVRVLRSDLKAETSLRRALEARVNGIEERIFEELQAIRQMLMTMSNGKG